MDYESKYNELVEAVRTVVDDNPSLFNVYDDLGRLRDLLPQKESEDERIREEIIQFFKDASSGKTRVITSETFVKWIEFLEKWKDNKFTPRVLPCSAAWFEDSEESEQKEQKPTEWSEDFEENIRNLLHDKLTGHSEDGSMSWTTLIDDKTLKDIVNGIWFYVGKEALKYPNKELSQPEWSEEDKNNLNRIVEILVEGSNVQNWWSKERLISKDEMQKLTDWLKYLFKRFNFQPKQEWSEEDEWKRNELL